MTIFIDGVKHTVNSVEIEKYKVVDNLYSIFISYDDGSYVSDEVSNLYEMGDILQVIIPDDNNSYKVEIITFDEYNLELLGCVVSDANIFEKLTENESKLLYNYTKHAKKELADLNVRVQKTKEDIKEYNKLVDIKDNDLHKLNRLIKDISEREKLANLLLNNGTRVKDSKLDKFEIEVNKQW